MSVTPVIVRSVAVVVHDSGVLLVTGKQSPDAWVPPGGKLEHGEPAHECAAREVLEESGVAVRVGDLIGYREVWRAEGDMLELYFTARPVEHPRDGRQRSGDGREVVWFPVGELDVVPHFPPELGDLCRLASGSGSVPLHLEPLDLTQDGS